MTAFSGDGIWNRDGYHNEGVTFDPALAHQAGNNHHYHAQPLGLRYQLGDHVDYNETTNTYTESAAPVTKHSPIVGWAADGLPVYGPYGYSDPTNAGSGVRRMVSGFALRNGANGTTNITVRQVLPLWAQRVQNKTALTTTQYGPAVNATYLLGHYIEDFDYRGDLGQTQTTGATVRDFDLNEQNVRFCVTPDFPSGTWAYFTTINADNTPAYPYTTGRQYFGNPTGGNVTSVTEPVSSSFMGGPFTADAARNISWAPATGDVTFVWSGVEGGTYRVDASDELSSWNLVISGVTMSGDDQIGIAEPGAVTANAKRFYRVERTALATYDKGGFAGTYFTVSTPVGGGANTVTPNIGNRGSTVSVVIELPLPLPAANVGVTSITFGSGTGVTASAIARYSQTIMTANFTITAQATTGARNVIVTFNGAQVRTITNGFTVQ